jgi:hypothetical protein
MTRINIELSAQELELALKLAKAAGYESIEDFIRFTLLRPEDSHLTIDGSQMMGSRDQMQRINGELRRLRNELRGFLVESSLVSDVSAAGSAPSYPQGATQLQLSLEIGSKGQEGAGLTPLQPGQGQEEGSHQSKVQSIQLGYDRRAPGFKFNAEDQLEDMAGAAFKNSPQLGAGTSFMSADSSQINLQSEESYPIEELVDDDPLPSEATVSASIAGLGIDAAKQPVPRKFAGIDVEALFNGTALSLADALVQSASDANATTETVAPIDNPAEMSSNAPSMPSDGAPASIIRVGAEAKMPKISEAKPVDEAGLPDTGAEKIDDAQKANGEAIPSETVNPGQIKSPGISGNLPPRKRKS